MPVSPEMNILDAEIRGHEQLVAWGNAQHRTIVANAGYYRTSAVSRAANLADQLAFAKWHANHYIAGSRVMNATGTRYT